MFVVFREEPSNSPDWQHEKRYVLARPIFWTMPEKDMEQAEKFWNNIRANVLADTLQDADNTFWRLKDGHDFHVRPKAQTSKDKYNSPVSGKEVPKKEYWFNCEYVRSILVEAYGQEWKNLFERKPR